MVAIRIICGLCVFFVSTNLSTAQLLSRGESTRYPTSNAVIPTSSTTAPQTLIDFIEPNFKAEVSSVLQKPTLSTKHTEESFSANPVVYKWLLDHPDRTALAWERLGVPCLPIREKAAQSYQYKDENTATELNWQSVGTIPDGRVWLATGKVKPGALFPTVPVKVVAMIRHPIEKTLDGKTVVTPTVRIYFQTDSRAAATVMRLAGPAAPRMAEEGAEQLLFFFSGMARYLDKHPDQTATLLSPAKKTVTK
ncbi:MAG: hypothetical protein U0798_05520 [Gemmataceae bacterium]